MKTLRSAFTSLAITLGLSNCSSVGLQGGGYKIEGGRVVHYSGFPATVTPVTAADARTFKALNQTYGKDNAHVFLRAKIVDGADPRSFQVLGSSAYCRDRAHGFHNGQIISDDPAHFALVPDPEDDGQGRVTYARDSTKVYRYELPIEGVDPATFVWVPMFNGNYLTHDKFHVYENNYPTPVKDADGASFKKLSNIYFRDNRHIWFLSLGRETRFEQLPQADAATFIALTGGWGKDKTHVYREGRVVGGFDPATFQPPKSE